MSLKTESTNFRLRVNGGGYELLGSFTEDVLEAMQSMPINDEAAFANSVCKPFLIAKLDKLIIAP